ncbi:alpha amylase [Pyronema domesticum]|nr:alpha amylase [Pyronema domesticum]
MYHSQLISWLLLSFSLISLGAPANDIVKRATQVSLISQSYSSNVLSGSIKIQNIAYAKAVSVLWTSGSSGSQTITASYSSGPDSTGYEVWSFSGTAKGATKFNIQYTVSGSTYYDPAIDSYYSISTGSSTSTPASSTTTSTTKSSTTSAPTGTALPSVNLPAILPVNFPAEAPATSPSGCGNWNGLDSCPDGTTFNFTASSEKRRWQTPPKGDVAYVSTFQDYNSLIGYSDIQYNSAHTSAVVTVNAASKSGDTLSYNFGGTSQTSPSFTVNSGFGDALSITVTSSSGKTLVLEPLNFVWQNADVTAVQKTYDGQKGAIVELFGWPYNDVAKECVFLGKAGYMGVKVWPPNEHVWGSNYYETDGQFRPWYLVYQPVSYKLQSRQGTRDELRAMTQACRKAGVRVYADAVLNHMSGQGNDIQNHRNTDCSLYSGHNATANSPYFTSGNTFLISPFTNTRPTLEYPAVPYGPTDFHCERSLNDWNSGDIITKGWLVGLTDLNTERDYVQDRLATYVVDLLSIGFSGIRVDAAKHIGPQSQAQIFGRVASKMGGSLPGDFIAWLEVIIGGEKDLMACSGGQWSWYTNFDNQLSAAGLSSTDIQKIKIWSSDYPKEMPICGSWIIPASRFAIQNDDHDQQSGGSSSRDMGDQGSVLVKDKDVAKHRAFEVKLFTRTDADWQIKMLLSSYMFMDNGGAGFPDGLSDCSLYTGSHAVTGCLGVPKDIAYVASACGYTMSQGKYTRPHRDLSIINAMRSWVGLGSTTASELGIAGCT